MATKYTCGHKAQAQLGGEDLAQVGHHLAEHQVRQVFSAGLRRLHVAAGGHTRGGGGEHAGTVGRAEEQGEHDQAGHTRVRPGGQHQQDAEHHAAAG